MHLKIENKLTSWKIANYLFSHENKLFQLDSIFGLGPNLLNRSFLFLGTQKTKLVRHVSQSFRLKTSDFIFASFIYGPRLKNHQFMRIQYLRSVGNLSSFRRFKKLPLRGQRTKTNAKTVKR